MSFHPPNGLIAAVCVNSIYNALVNHNAGFTTFIDSLNTKENLSFKKTYNLEKIDLAQHRDKYIVFYIEESGNQTVGIWTSKCFEDDDSIYRHSVCNTLGVVRNKITDYFRQQNINTHTNEKDKLQGQENLVGTRSKSRGRSLDTQRSQSSITSGQISNSKGLV